MDAVFYLLLLLNFGIGAFCVVFLLIAPMEPHDPGAKSLALPFFPLLTITLLQVVDYYLLQRFPGRPSTTIHILYDLALAMIAFSWNYIAFLHYHLNGVDRERRGTIRIIGIATIALAAGTVVGHIRVTQIVPVLHALLMALLFHAGIKGVLVTRKAKHLFPSSCTARTIAAISLGVYPVIAVGDVLEWRVPFLDPGVSFWAQAHPLYITTITIPLFLYTYHHRTWAPGTDVSIPSSAPRDGLSPAPPEAARASGPLIVVGDEITRRLTTRENEILLLLYEGFRYREIAQKLFISLTTVRTHIHHIYEKLEVSRKEELFIAIRNAQKDTTIRTDSEHNLQI